MSAEIVPGSGEGKTRKVKYQGGASDSVYGLGLIGAWVYYIGRAKTIQEGALGFFKGILWPAFLVYELLEFLNKDRSE
jgi:hypothetical protein